MENDMELEPLYKEPIGPEPDNCSGDAGPSQPTINEIFNVIDDEEQKLLELENRRKRLSADIDKLRSEIEEEKVLFRQAIDSEISKKYDATNKTTKDNENENDEILQIDPLYIDKQLIDECIETYRNSIENEPTQDLELKKIKMNLEEYEKSLVHGKREKIEKTKRRAEAEVFQRHLKQLGVKCNAQKEKIESVRKYIDKIQTSTNDEINIDDPEV